jgi:hypothetical protein
MKAQGALLLAPAAAKKRVFRPHDKKRQAIFILRKSL